MATGSILLLVGAAVPSDGSASNAAPQPVTKIGTEANPKKRYLTYAFDAGTDEMMTFSFQMPQEYASGGTLRIKWTTSVTTSTAVIWAAKVSAVTAGDADTRAEHASSTAATVSSNTNTTEAGREAEATITLNMDSAAAGDMIDIVFYRDADNGSDSLAVDASLEGLNFEFTTT